MLGQAAGKISGDFARPELLHWNTVGWNIAERPDHHGTGLSPENPLT